MEFSLSIDNVVKSISLSNGTVVMDNYFGPLCIRTRDYTYMHHIIYQILTEPVGV